MGGTKWVGENSTHPASLIMSKSQKIDLPTWEAAVEEENLRKAMGGSSLGGKGDFQIEKVEVGEDEMGEVPGGKIRFKGARNSVKLTKEEMKKARERLEGGGKGDFQIHKVEVGEDEMDEVRQNKNRRDPAQVPTLTLFDLLF